MKKIIIILGCISIIFILFVCKKVNNDPIPVYDLTQGSKLYERVGETDKSNVDTFLGQVKEIHEIGSKNKDDWYSTKFREGDKIYMFKGMNENEILIVEERGYYFKMKRKYDKK